MCNKNEWWIDLLTSLKGFLFISLFYELFVAISGLHFVEAPENAWLT